MSELSDHTLRLGGFVQPQLCWLVVVLEYARRFVVGVVPANPPWIAAVVALASSYQYQWQFGVAGWCDYVMCTSFVHGTIVWRVLA